jgi:uncharacterized protein YecT (DUF1311 family)
MEAGFRNTTLRYMAALAGFVLAATLGAAPPARAMEWTHRLDLSERVNVFEGKGAVVPDDFRRLQAAIVASKVLQEEPKVGGVAPSWMFGNSLNNRRLLVSLNSEGGSMIGGLALGAFIRESGLDTIVPSGAECHSACTIAFLGGVARTVVGKFGIHAMSIDEKAAKAQGGISDENLYVVQALSSSFIRYTRDMLGRTELADVSLRIGLKTTIAVDDASLRDWNVITVAFRPAQMYPISVVTTLDCDSDSATDRLYVVRRLTCKDLGLVRSEIRLAEALRALRSRPETKAVDAEQTRWIAVRNACEKRAVLQRPAVVFQKPEPFGEKHVQDCLSRIYGARLQELEALAAYHAVRDDYPAKGWQEEAK